MLTGSLFEPFLLDTAFKAGRELLACYRPDGVPVIATKAAQFRNLLTEADRRSERLVLQSLAEHYPAHDVCAEETRPTLPDKRGEFLWLVDPLDGTVNFSRGIPQFCVSMAVLDAEGPLAGIVHAPYQGETWLSARGGGAFFLRHAPGGEPDLGRALRCRVTASERLDQAVICTGFSYHHDEGARTNFDNFAALGKRALAARRFGAAALDLCFVALGRFDAYWEFWLQPWDVAAGALIVREAGGTVSDLQGGERWLFEPEIVASNGPLHATLLSLLEAR